MIDITCLCEDKGLSDDLQWSFQDEVNGEFSYYSLSYTTYSNNPHSTLIIIISE